MKKVIIGACFMMMWTFVAGTVCAEGPVTLKMAGFEPPTSFVNTKVLSPWIEMVNKEGEGVLKIEFYPGGSLGRDPKIQLKLILDGVADLAFILNPYTPGRFPDDQVVNVPFVANNPLESALALNALYEKGLLRGYDDVVVMGHFTACPYTIHSVYPVKRPEDMKGKKFKATDKMQFALMEAVGGTPVGISVFETAEAISRGVLSGLLGEMNSMNVSRTIQVVKHHCAVNFGTTNQMCAISRKTYEGLPVKARAILDKYKGEFFSKLWGERLTKECAIVKKKYTADPEHTWYTPSATEMKQWRSLMDPVVDKWTRTHPNGEKLIQTYKDEVLKVRGN
jgi:TRAP-type C4-dicarboxylate transport system substrate-binding protein